MSSYRLKPFSDDPCPPAEVDPNRYLSTPNEDAYMREMGLSGREPDDCWPKSARPPAALLEADDAKEAA